MLDSCENKENSDEESTFGENLINQRNDSVEDLAKKLEDTKLDDNSNEWERFDGQRLLKRSFENQDSFWLQRLVKKNFEPKIISTSYKGRSKSGKRITYGREFGSMDIVIV